MFREREGKKVIEVAKNAGAKSVEFSLRRGYGDCSSSESAEGAVAIANEWLTDDAPAA
jgi:hypothetical protein